MKKAIFTIIIFLGILSKTAFAQQEEMGRKTAEQRTEIATKELAATLALTPEQTEEVRDVILRREKLRDAGKLSKENKKEIHDDLNKILSKDQQKQLKQMQKDKKVEKSS